VLEELALDAELNILQSYDRVIGRGRQRKPLDSAARDDEAGIQFSL